MDRLQASGSRVPGAFRLVGGGVEGAQRLPDEAGAGQLSPADLQRPGSLRGTLRATGEPRSVITTSSPARTRERNSLRRALIPPIDA